MPRFHLTHFHVPALHVPHIVWPWEGTKRTVRPDTRGHARRPGRLDQSLEDAAAPAPKAVLAGLMVAGAAILVAAVMSTYTPIEAVDAAPLSMPEIVPAAFSDPYGGTEEDSFALAKHLALQEELPPQF